MPNDLKSVFWGPIGSTDSGMLKLINWLLLRILNFILFSLLSNSIKSLKILSFWGATVKRHEHAHIQPLTQLIYHTLILSYLELGWLTLLGWLALLGWLTGRLSWLRFAG